MNDPDNYGVEFGSFLVITASIISAILAGTIATAVFGGCLFLPVAIVTGLAYPFLGAFLVPLCEELRAWANPREEPMVAWKRGERIVIGALWPITVPAFVILYIFLGIIARVY